MTRIQDKINDINKFLKELETIVPSEFIEYKSSLVKKSACERYVEKIVEAATDLAFLTIKIKKLRIPEDDIDAFRILLENKIIDEKLAKKLQNAKGMRNIIAHEYGKIDDAVVFNAIKEELIEDIGRFLNEIKKKA